MSGIAANVLNVISNVRPPSAKSGMNLPGDMQTILPTLPQSSPNQTLFREDSATTSTLSTTQEDIEQGDELKPFFSSL